eukprot:752807-Hanusia_phi.AAC.4
MSSRPSKAPHHSRYENGTHLVQHERIHLLGVVNDHACEQALCESVWYQRVLEVSAQVERVEVIEVGELGVGHEKLRAAQLSLRLREAERSLARSDI